MRKLIITIFFVAIFSPLVSSQTPNPNNPSWSIGWEVEEDEVLMNLDSTFQFETILTFWIDNARPLPSEYEIDIEITYPSDCENSFSIGYDSKVNVEANTNETFEIKISGDGYGKEMDGNWQLCPISEVFSLELSVNDLIVAGQAGDGSKTIEQNLRFSSAYVLYIEFTETDNWNLVDNIKSGTSEFVGLVIENKGNSIDSLRDSDFMFRYCPQMDYSIIEGGTDGNANLGESWNLMIELTASSSHPDKNCELIFSVVSEGNGYTYVEVLEFNVEAIDIKEESEKSEEKEDSESSELGAETSSMPAISSLLCIITVIFSAFCRQKWQ